MVNMADQLQMILSASDCLTVCRTIDEIMHSATGMVVKCMCKQFLLLSCLLTHSMFQLLLHGFGYDISGIAAGKY